jgi:hypothetical protein
MIQLQKSGKSLVVISMQLDMSGTMLDICQGVFANKQGSRDNQTSSSSGRKPTLGPTDEHALVRKVWSNPTSTMKQLFQKSEASEAKLSPSTIKRVMHRNGLRGCRVHRKPLLQTNKYKSRI